VAVASSAKARAAVRAIVALPVDAVGVMAEPASAPAAAVVAGGSAEAAPRASAPPVAGRATRRTTPRRATKPASAVPPSPVAEPRVVAAQVEALRPEPASAVPPSPVAEPRVVAAQVEATRPVAKAAAEPGAAARPARLAAAKKPGRVSTLLPAACPTCGRLLEVIPTATRRCADCRAHIVVKRVDGRIVLVAETVSRQFEAERRRIVDSERYKREGSRWLQMAALAGAAPEILEARARAVAARPTPEAVVSARTLYDTTVERACHAARRAHDWRFLTELRWRQARAYHRAAGSPVPPDPNVLALLREGIEASLRRIAEVARDAELAAGTCCETCEADAGRVVRISSELRVMSVPHVQCAAGLCGCRWDIPAKQREAVAKLARHRTLTGAAANSRMRREP
jgi:DNA-directed RNA polymerase subunit RPC12/RpoP